MRSGPTCAFDSRCSGAGMGLLDGRGCLGDRCQEPLNGAVPVSNGGFLSPGYDIPQGRPRFFFGERSRNEDASTNCQWTLRPDIPLPPIHQRVRPVVPMKKEQI